MNDISNSCQAHVFAVAYRFNARGILWAELKGITKPRNLCQRLIADLKVRGRVQWIRIDSQKPCGQVSYAPKHPGQTEAGILFYIVFLFRFFATIL